MLPKRGFGQIQLIQVLNETLNSLVVGTGRQEPPIELAVGIPFAALADFATHEEEHFPGEKPLVTEQRAKIGKAAPVITRHAGKERTFAVDDFVVRKRENEIFVVMIEHREREIVLMVFAMHRVAAEINQSV